jgi:hypothetical protein
LLLSSPFFLEGLTLDINHHCEERRFLHHQPDPVFHRNRSTSQELQPTAASLSNRRWVAPNVDNVRFFMPHPCAYAAMPFVPR